MRLFYYIRTVSEKEKETKKSSPTLIYIVLKRSIVFLSQLAFWRLPSVSILHALYFFLSQQVMKRYGVGYNQGIFIFSLHLYLLQRQWNACFSCPTWLTSYYYHHNIHNVFLGCCVLVRPLWQPQNPQPKVRALMSSNKRQLQAQDIARQNVSRLLA